MNVTLLDEARVMLIHVWSYKSYTREAVLHTAYLCKKNREFNQQYDNTSRTGFQKEPDNSNDCAPGNTEYLHSHQTQEARKLSDDSKNQNYCCADTQFSEPIYPPKSR